MPIHIQIYIYIHIYIYVYIYMYRYENFTCCRKSSIKDNTVRQVAEQRQIEGRLLPGCSGLVSRV